MKAGGHRHHKTEHGDETISAGAKDPHIWLSPPLVMVQAKNILEGLVKADPEGRMVHQASYKAFFGELKALNREIQRIFQETGQNARFMVYHPLLGLFHPKLRTGADPH